MIIQSLALKALEVHEMSSAKQPKGYLQSFISNLAYFLLTSLIFFPHNLMVGRFSPEFLIKNM